ncbi:MAG: DNA-processing protein DprA [Burkholderiales bacterium]|nr:DNA-processing protein DprA [Burkholderiales bacterium]
MIDIKQIIKNNSSLESWLRLGLTSKVGPRTIFKLLEHFGSIENILEQNLTTLEQFTNKTVAKLIYSRISDTFVSNSIKWQQQKPNRHLISIQDNRYPLELLQISDPPVILYLEGDISYLNKKKFAIVGTRHPTNQGAENAMNFARDLSNNGLTIVSGVASGVDRYAHLGALQGKYSTIGVIGTGVDVRYPKTNSDIYDKIIESGLLVSEFAIGTMPLSQNFPRRNRIVAGLSIGLLVVESTIDGGSLISANLALEMGREVMAIPGSIYNPVAKGCHKLIKSGAKLVENVNDILEEIMPMLEESIIDESQCPEPILEIMGFEPINIDALCIKVQQDFSEICAKLLEFELSGLITNCGGGYYQRIFK